jgi:hypothetical protein
MGKFGGEMKIQPERRRDDHHGGNEHTVQAKAGRTEHSSDQNTSGSGRYEGNAIPEQQPR